LAESVHAWHRATTIRRSSDPKRVWLSFQTISFIVPMYGIRGSTKKRPLF